MERVHEMTSKLTALIEAAKAATPGPWRQVECLENGMTPEILGPTDDDLICRMYGGQYQVVDSNSAFITLANPATILELCALLEKAEAAMNSPSGRKYVEALAAIRQWKEMK